MAPSEPGLRVLEYQPPAPRISPWRYVASFVYGLVVALTAAAVILPLSLMIVAPVCAALGWYYAAPRIAYVPSALVCVALAIWFGTRGRQVGAMIGAATMAGVLLLLVGLTLWRG